jgi:hypothetical protein
MDKIKCFHCDRVFSNFLNIQSLNLDVYEKYIICKKCFKKIRNKITTCFHCTNKSDPKSGFILWTDEHDIPWIFMPTCGDDKCFRHAVKLIKQKKTPDCSPLFSICRNCGAAREKMLWCSQCKIVKYCSKECQKLNWPIHKSGCRVK